jgi:hypothetical protein
MDVRQGKPRVRHAFSATRPPLGEVEAFVRGHLTDQGMATEQSKHVAEAVREALSAASTARTDSYLEVRVRLRGALVEVEVVQQHDYPVTALGDQWPERSFAHWLSGLLKNQHLSQEAAARRIGVSLKTVNRWLRGETEPRFRELALIYDALGEWPLAPSE